MNNPVVKRMNLINMGCRVNWAETEQLRQQGIDMGYLPVGEGEEADLVVINTCSVTGESERQARQLIRRVVRQNPQARVVVTGCYAERDPNSLTAMAGVDLVVGNKQKNALLQWVERPGPMSTGEPPAKPVLGGVERARVFLQVQNGCSQRCTFCVIPPLRGASRSIPLPQVVEQAEGYLAAGLQELVLSGINLGEYGRDLQPALSLSSLVENLLKLPGLARLRLSSLHPADLDDSLLALFADSPLLCSHLHLSVQSGDNLILKRMGRHYSRDDVINMLQRLRSLRQEMIFGGDFIVGFPTESEAAFQNTLNFILDAGFSLLHVFPYSDRPGTPAASIPTRFRLAGEIVRQRSLLLRQAGKKNLLISLKNLINQESQILVESVHQGVGMGKNSGFLPVVCKPLSERWIGQLLPCRVVGLDEDGLSALAEPLPGSE